MVIVARVAAHICCGRKGGKPEKNMALRSYFAENEKKGTSEERDGPQTSAGSPYLP